MNTNTGNQETTPTYYDNEGNRYAPTGEARIPTDGEFYVSTRFKPGTVVQNEGNDPSDYSTVKIIVTPAANENTNDYVYWDDEDAEDTPWDNAPTASTVVTAATPHDGCTYFDINGDEYAHTGEVRFPGPLEYYVSNNSAPGQVKQAGEDAPVGFTTPKAIVTPSNQGQNVLSGAGETATATSANRLYNEILALLGLSARSVSATPQDHPLGEFIRSTAYETVGRSTAASVTVIMPGEGATATMTGVGLSVCNPEDDFDEAEGRRIALLRALDNIHQHL